MFWSSWTWAADGGQLTIKRTPLSPKLSKVGNEYVVDFQDGREARMYQQIGKVARTHLPLRQTENTCDYNQVLSSCRFEFDIASVELSLRWTKHPNAAKIGEIVVLKNGQGEDLSISDEFNFYFWYHTQTFGEYKSLFKPDRIVCDQTNWAQSIPVKNAHLTIDSWASESMAVTNETNVNENQTLSVVFDVVLKKIDNQTFEFESFGQAKQSLGNLPPHFSFQVATLHIMDKNKQPCMVSFESSIAEVQRLIGDAEFKKTDPTTRLPLNNGTQYKYSNFKFSFETLLNSLRGSDGRKPGEVE